jgi:polysaccharide pyruvyl transferase CsaB
LLQDVTSAHSIFYYLGVVRLAQILGKRTMFIAQGIGPLDLYRSKKLTAFVARNCDAITVRDPGSAELLKTIGVDHPSIQVAADPALILAPEQQIDPSSSKNVFISLRPWNGNDELVETLTASINDAKLDIDQLIPIACSSEDTDILALLKNSLKQTGLALPDAGVLTYSQIIDEVNGSPLMIGMRLHALILATACGVPCVALSYDPKVRAFMETTGQEDAVYDIRTSDPAKLTAIIQRVWQSRSQIQQTLADKLPHLCSAASSNAALALSLVKDL